MKAFALFLAVALLSSVLGGTAAAHDLVSINVERIGNLVRTEAVIEDGDPQNRFTLHHVRKLGRSRGSIVLLPGGNANFAFYEAHPDGYGSSFAGTLAAAGYDVFGYSPRNRGLPATVCDGGDFDCSVIAGWGFETVLRGPRLHTLLRRAGRIRGGNRSWAASPSGRLPPLPP